jgi:hypothetical protein
MAMKHVYTGTTSNEAAVFTLEVKIITKAEDSITMPLKCRRSAHSFLASGQTVNQEFRLTVLRRLRGAVRKKRWEFIGSVVGFFTTALSV